MYYEILFVCAFHKIYLTMMNFFTRASLPPHFYGHVKATLERGNDCLDITPIVRRRQLKLVSREQQAHHQLHFKICKWPTKADARSSVEHDVLEVAHGVRAKQRLFSLALLGLLRLVCLLPSAWVVPQRVFPEVRRPPHHVR